MDDKDARGFSYAHSDRHGTLKRRSCQGDKKYKTWASIRYKDNVLPV